MFSHAAYIRTLPSTHALLTPLHWSTSELALSRGTNLHHATLSRLTEWQVEYASALEILRSASLPPALLGGITWPVCLCDIYSRELMQCTKAGRPT
jgi:hypothetical protein